MVRGIVNIVILLFAYSCSPQQTDTQATDEYELTLFDNLDRLKGTGHYQDGKKVGTWVYDSITVFWNSYHDSLKNFSSIYPDNWAIQQEEDAFFWAAKPNAEDFLVALRFDTNATGLNIESYAIEAAKQLEAGSLPILEYTTVDMMLDNQKAFYSFHTVGNDRTLFAFLTFYTTKGSYIYDFTYKFQFSSDKELERSEIIFWEYLYHFQVGNNYLINKNGLSVIKPNN